MHNFLTAAGLDGHCWPTPVQEHLLYAALTSGDDAVNAWRTWREEVDLEHIDSGSFRLLPLLYKNLLDLNVQDPVMQKLKGVYRRTWYHNQILFRDLIAFLQLFRDSRLDSMVLKGVALVLFHYKDYGVRPMDDCDLLVPYRQAEAAMELLQRSGWKPEYWRTDINVNYLHGMGFIDESGRRLDLHWHVLEECLQPEAGEIFWNGAVSTNLRGERVLALNPTDQLLHVCVHGIRWNHVPPLRWIADAMTLLRTAVNGIDWNRLVSRVEDCGVVLPVCEGLQYLRERMGASIPEEALFRLRRLSPTKVERRCYEITTRRPTAARRLLFHWYNHQRLVQSRGLERRAERFIGYLLKRWGLRSMWNLPAYVFTETMCILNHKARTRRLLTRKL